MTLDDRVRGWVEGVWGREVVAAHALTGGITSQMVLLTASDGERSVLRLMTMEPWRRHAVGLLSRERKVQTLLAATPVPAPTSIAADADGDDAGAPAHLMTLLPGSLELGRADGDLLGRLSAALSAIHAFDPGDGRRPREYQSWAHEAKRVVPAWSSRKSLWRRAFQLLEATAPPFEGTFLHRDFHLGNVLWQGGEVSGVVDWVETSWGPAELDVAHCATYLAMLHGPWAADRFLARHPAAPPGQSLGADAAYWHLMDVVGHLPQPEKVAGPWRSAGALVADRVAHDRLERWLQRALDEPLTRGRAGRPGGVE